MCKWSNLVYKLLLYKLIHSCCQTINNVNLNRLSNCSQNSTGKKQKQIFIQMKCFFLLPHIPFKYLEFFQSIFANETCLKTLVTLVVSFFNLDYTSLKLYYITLNCIIYKINSHPILFPTLTVSLKIVTLFKLNVFCVFNY